MKMNVLVTLDAGYLDPLTVMLMNLKELRIHQDEQWVIEHSSVIHYCGRNKPWKEHYIGKLGIFYYWYARVSRE